MACGWRKLALVRDGRRGGGALVLHGGRNQIVLILVKRDETKLRFWETRSDRIGSDRMGWDWGHENGGDEGTVPPRRRLGGGEEAKGMRI
jgi:hypothetical protein